MKALRSVDFIGFPNAKNRWTPAIVPTDGGETVYLVASDFGKLGRAWREADYEATDMETVIQDLLIPLDRIHRAIARIATGQAHKGSMTGRQHS